MSAPQVFTVNGAHYVVSAPTIARLVNQREHLTAVVEAYLANVADHGLPPTQLQVWEEARRALAGVQS